MEEKEPDSYVARAGCGCFIGAIVNAPDYRKQVASFLSENVLAGFSFDRMETADVRSLSWKCAIHKEGTRLMAGEGAS